MNIWWCEEHEASGDGSAWQCLREGAGSCRMVEMELVPVVRLPTVESLDDEIEAAARLFKVR